MKTQEERGHYDPMPYVAKLLREKLLMEEKNLEFFEKNLSSQDPLVVRQANGSIPSNKNRVEELQNALEFLKTYKKEVKGKSAVSDNPSK